MLPVALQELLDTPRSAERQEFIDTLPIAIAIIALVDAKASILARNKAFLQLADRRGTSIPVSYTHLTLPTKRIV